MSATTMVSTGMPRTMTTWIKLGCGALAVAAAWWGLSSFDYERIFRRPRSRRLNAAGPLGPLLLIGGMVGAVIVQPIPSLPLDLAAGAAFGPFYGALYAVIDAILCCFIARVLGREALSHLMKPEYACCRMCMDHQLMVAFFLAMPKILAKYRTSPFARSSLDRLRPRRSEWKSLCRSAV